MESERDLDTKASTDWCRTGILLQDPSKIGSKATTALNLKTSSLLLKQASVHQTGGAPTPAKHSYLFLRLM